MKDLATTTVGAVVEPGRVLLSLVPVGESLVAEVYIRNEDIGFVSEGQSARVKLAAYPFTKYGMIEGVVETVSADAARLAATDAAPDSNDSSAGQTSSPFRARVRLAQQSLSLDGVALPTAAGMQVSAEIRQGERTVMEYLLSPVRRVAMQAAGER